MNAMDKVLLLVIFSTIRFVEHTQAKHYLVETETKVNPEPQQEKEAEAKGEHIYIYIYITLQLI